mgnify:CR=1 FL=1
MAVIRSEDFRGCHNNKIIYRNNFLLSSFYCRVVRAHRFFLSNRKSKGILMSRAFRVLTGVCAALAIASANAATISYSFTNPLSTTEINQTGSLALFDSQLGTLTGASLTVTGDLESIVTLVNRAAQSQRVKLIGSSDVGLTSSLGVVDQLFDHYSDVSVSVDTGLQTLAPGATYTSPLLTGQKIRTENLNTALAILSAPGGGNFTLNCRSESGVSVSGGGGQCGLFATDKGPVRCDNYLHL